jgi:uncharacterized membrane protein
LADCSIAREARSPLERYQQELRAGITRSDDRHSPARRTTRRQSGGPKITRNADDGQARDCDDQLVVANAGGVLTEKEFASMESKNVTTARNARWETYSPLIGVLLVALSIVSFAVGSPARLPATDSSAATVVSYVTAHRGSLDTVVLLTSFQVFVGLFFFGLVRSWLRAGSEYLAAIGYAGVVLFAAGGAVNAGTIEALVDNPSKLNPVVVQTLNVLAKDLSIVFFAGVGVLLLAFGLAIIRTGTLPVWLGWLGIILGVFGILPLGGIDVAAGMLWVLLASICMVSCRRSQRTRVSTPSQDEAQAVR